MLLFIYILKSFTPKGFHCMELFPSVKLKKSYVDLENSTTAFIVTLASRKLVQFQFWVKFAWNKISST